MIMGYQYHIITPIPSASAHLKEINKINIYNKYLKYYWSIIENIVKFLQIILNEY